MANLLRLIVAVLLLCCSTAWASFAMPSAYETGGMGPVGGARGSTPVEACNAMFAKWVAYTATNPSAYPGTYTNGGIQDADTPLPWCKFINPVMGNTGPYVTKVPGMCPDGANAGTNAHGEAICTCAAGLRESNGQCTALPENCEVGYEWSDVEQRCVIKKCKPNEIRVNSVCQPDPDLCDDGKKKVNGKCEEACPKAGTFAGEYKVGGITPSTFCENKCTVTISSFVQAVKGGKVQEVIGMGHYTGASCSGPGFTPPDPDKPNNPGNPDPNNPNNPNNPGNPGTGPGGGGGNTNGGNNTNPGGGSNSNPEKCPNGDCTGTKNGGKPTGGTETGSDGKCPPGTYKSGGKCYPNDAPESDPDDDGKCPPGTKKVNGRCVAYQPPSDGEQEEADKFCKENPDVPMCKKSTFQGACEAGFKCDGDAIFCSIAREQHSRNCKLFDTKSAESDLYDKNKGKEGEQTKDLPGNRTESMANRINTSDALGGGQCVGDLPITVLGQAITLPISKICPAIAVIGNILVAVALLAAVGIVGRG